MRKIAAVPIDALGSVAGRGADDSWATGAAGRAPGPRMGYDENRSHLELSL
jgi:hypothetical protein